MLFRLIILFTIIPLIELVLLIKIGGIIGLIPTITIVILTGILGASLTRNQGIMVINKIKTEMNSGRVPTESLLNGVLILVGGIVLLTPGLLTDLFGFMLLIPITRDFFKKILKEKLKNHIDKNNTYTTITIN